MQGLRTMIAAQRKQSPAAVPLCDVSCVIGECKRQLDSGASRKEVESELMALGYSVGLCEALLSKL